MAITGQDQLWSSSLRLHIQDIRKNIRENIRKTSTKINNNQQKKKLQNRLQDVSDMAIEKIVL